MPTDTLFHAILSYAIQTEASDIHLVSGMPPKLRIKGEIRSTNFPVLLASAIESIVHDIMPKHLKEIFNANEEIDFAFVEKQNLNRRFRVNVFCQHSGLGVVFRVLPLKIPTLDDLRLPTVLKEIALLKQGLILITGSTGSGKTSTLAAIVDYINEQTFGHIITIEDPIEFLHHSKNCLMTQRELYRDTKSFDHALYSALRADPNVILVGELRDLNTIRLALTAAETGHLVLATLHTVSAEKTLHRILDVFPGNEREMVRSLLSESLQAVIAQQLIRNVHDERIPLVEVLRCTPAIRHLIRENKINQIISAMQTGQSIGMQTFEQHLDQLVRLGEVRRV